MNRAEMWSRVRARRGAWDMLVVGGGATGVGVAIDAASRGYAVLLLEQGDFCQGTSSRSTKLVHGGVRYLKQGNIGLVMEALKERGLLLRNAPHLVTDLGFVVPNYDWWEAPFYGLGLRVYRLLAGRYGFGESRTLSREETLERLPNIRDGGLRSGVVYYDGQFDDSRLLIHMVATAFEQGAALLNYVAATGLTKDAQGFVDGVIARDAETGAEMGFPAKVVINATGPWADDLRRRAEADAAPMIVPSQGVHLVLDRAFLPGRSAIMVPHTDDGRVLFAIPWHEHTLLGTTDTPIRAATLEPVATEQEVEFLLSAAARYLAHPPGRADVLSVFAGVRPLVGAAGAVRTASLSRDHAIHIDPSGLLTVCGGKWTTYRRMAQDCVNQAALMAELPERPCITHHLKIHGFDPSAARFGPLSVYGTDANEIRGLMDAEAGLAEPLHPGFPYVKAQVVWAVRAELARTIGDVLARRTRALFLNARAAVEMAPAVADLLERELGWDGAKKAREHAAFQALAANYLVR